jgi:hypothetical protein
MRRTGYYRLRRLTLAVRIAATIPYVWLRVRLLPLPRALAGLMPPNGDPGRRALKGGTGRRSAATKERTDLIIHLTDSLLERRVALLRPSCMLRSLVLFRFLREAGLPVQVHFGVAREESALKGHSWLTLDGAPIAEPTDPSKRFQTVYSFPAE